MSEKIIEGNVLDEFKRDYTTFAIYSEMNRSVPKDRDGLIPVHRRVVFAAWYWCHANQKMKCANIVGATMAHCHPHGDESIKGALYTLVNWYSTKYPLFDGQGNFGNTFTNTGAAYRYTEAKLSDFCKECVLDEMIKFEEVVDWIPNYDNKSREPLYLPVKVPLLLLNGSMHMSVGDKVDIPSHNLGEVIDATIHLIQNPDSEVSLVPDHCQACEIFDADWDDISRKGFGYYKVRGVIEVADYFGRNKRYNGRKVLVIRSCPNMTYLSKIIEKIEELVKDNKIIGIEDTEDESKVNDMRFILVLRPGVDPEYVRQALYQNTRLQQTCRINLKVFTDDGQNVLTHRVSYTEYLKQFILHRKIVKMRYYELLLQKIRTQLHQIENYIWVMDSKIDKDVLSVIRKQKNVDDDAMCEMLIKKFNITDLQAKFIMNMDVKKLSIGYYKQFCEERDRLRPIAQDCIDNIKDERKLEGIIIQELLDIKAKYNTPRKCRILSAAESSGVAQGTFKVTISEGNFVKKFGVNDNITGTRPGDSIKFVTVGDNTESLLIFDVNGKVYNLPISKIPFSDKSSAGVDIRVINKYINSPISCVIYAPALEKFKKGCIVTVTRQGFIKRMAVEDFMNVPPSGLVYSKIDQGDSVVDVMLFGKANADVVVYNESKALRININDIPVLKRNSRGNVSMGGANHEVLGMNVLRHDATEILGITSKGYINKITPEVVPSGRTKAGKNVIKLIKGDSLVSVLGVNESSSIRCSTGDGQFVDIMANQIPLSSSIASGTKVSKSGILKAWNNIQQ